MRIKIPDGARIIDRKQVLYKTGIRGGDYSDVDNRYVFGAKKNQAIVVENGEVVLENVHLIEGSIVDQEEISGEFEKIGKNEDNNDLIRGKVGSEIMYGKYKFIPGNDEQIEFVNGDIHAKSLVVVTDREGKIFGEILGVGDFSVFEDPEKEGVLLHHNFISEDTGKTIFISREGSTIITEKSLLISNGEASEEELNFGAPVGSVFDDADLLELGEDFVFTPNRLGVDNNVIFSIGEEKFGNVIVKEFQGDTKLTMELENGVLGFSKNEFLMQTLGGGFKENIVRLTRNSEGELVPMLIRKNTDTEQRQS